MQDMISVIVPVYKVEKYLDECVASIVAQTHKYLEIILVDDGSPDQCPAMCDYWAEKDSRIRVIHKENGGLSDARNAGIHEAAGDYIAFVDSDDWIAPEMYETMLSRLHQEEADICACGIMSTYPQRQQPWQIPNVTGSPEEILTLLYQNAKYPVAAWNKLYRRELRQNFCFPVGKICEDAMTTYRLIDRAKRIVQINTPFYYYRIRENSIMTSSFSPKKMDEEEAWRLNYEFMVAHYPTLRKVAFDFYLQRVNVLLHTISGSQKKEFAQEYATLRQILKKNVGYVLFASQLPCKQRVKLALDSIRG